MSTQTSTAAEINTTLCELKPGQQACICDLTRVHSTIFQRLLDLGVEEGSHVHMKRTSLFGGPLTLEANGQLFGIRRSVARLIGVKHT
ncbi:ferrous iron transport protein A [Paenibacillus profundus]|uniref:Ferrous iron transport protein A n=1 Tax=Paenibacillus profundus TaxID=1173085 RepID=A0ABS8YP58_9BACL|nr:FeoA family protein [Paenibacillus profundus]MCE5171384.1 ferrous iron transport protein A [Paenibacillus profundus]